MKPHGQFCLWGGLEIQWRRPCRDDFVLPNVRLAVLKRNPIKRLRPAATDIEPQLPNPATIQFSHRLPSRSPTQSRYVVRSSMIDRSTHSACQSEGNDHGTKWLGNSGQAFGGRQGQLLQEHGKIAARCASSLAAVPLSHCASNPNSSLLNANFPDEQLARRAER